MTRSLVPILIVSAVAILQVGAEANFEDSRCRCVCPSTGGFTSEEQNKTTEDQRRYYTMTNINPSLCTPMTVVKGEVVKHVDESRLDAFLANCNCRYQSRNTVMIKVVVIFVICVIVVLVAYMGFLMCLDPMLRKKRFQMPYRQQTDEMEDNIFARAQGASSSQASSSSASLDDANQMRSRGGNHVLGRVEAEQNRWMKKAEEQRRKVFEDHTMLN